MLNYLHLPYEFMLFIGTVFKLILNKKNNKLNLLVMFTDSKYCVVCNKNWIINIGQIFLITFITC